MTEKIEGFYLDGTEYKIGGDEAAWGNISGTLSDQTDLNTALSGKADKTDVLVKNNTTAFTPTGDYQPATKKYVDDSIDGITYPVTSVNGQTGDVTVESTSYTAGNGIDITNDEIGLDGTYDEIITHSDMQGPAPDGFHVPLLSERQAVYNAYTGLGLSGGTNFTTYLKLPNAGYRQANDLAFNDRGSYGHYWSSTADNTEGARDAYVFGASGVYFNGSYGRSNGLFVRCLKDSPVIPTSSWTKLYGTSIESGGIFHNVTSGLISISSNGSTWYTLMDKNLGATTVYNYGDALTESNCGKVYQRGNNYGFSGDANYDVSQITQSNTKLDVTEYGPGNYYSSSTWITVNPRQNLANDGKNLRGGVSKGSWVSQTNWNISIGDKLYKIVTSTSAPASGTSSNIITFVTA